MKWEHIKAACFRSLTIAWSYVLAVAGSFLQFVDNVGQVLGDPNLKHQIEDVFRGDPVMLGRVILGISVITILARARTLGKHN